MIAGVVILAGSSLFGQGKKGGAGGDAAKGKAVFDQNCAVCHNADSSEVKMGPGLKGLFKPGYKMKSGSAANDASVSAKIDAGGNGMPSYKDILSATEKADVIAYLKTL